MKKLFLAILLILFLTIGSIYAMSPAFLQMIGGGTGGCPPFYNATNVVFSWDGDHDSGTNYACDSAGNPLEGTNTNLTIHTDYGEAGSNGAYVDTHDENLIWTQTEDQYIDDVGPQTVWLRVFISDVPDTAYAIYEGNAGSGANYIGIKISSTNANITGIYRGNSAGDQVYGLAPTTGSFINIGYSWNYNTYDHSVYNGSSWDEDANETLNSLTAAIDAIVIGEDVSEADDAGPGHYTRIDQLVIIDGYEAAIPTGW